VWIRGCWLSTPVVQVLVDALPDVGANQADGDAVPALIVHLEEIGKRVETAVTSDGRDVELSVASTKAFYAQIAAGSLLVWHWGAW
jgi:hypothetical protein